MSHSKQAIGVDIGGTNLRVARIGGTGAVREQRAERSTRQPEAAIARVVALIRELDHADVAVIGIGVPGRVDFHRRAVLSGGYVNFAGHALAESVEQAIGKPVIIDNDGNMALTAEAAIGAARGQANVAMLTIGTGIGGAILQDGRILRGRLAAGQLGHITVDLNGLPCACGRQGCVETLSSGTAIAYHVAQAGLPAGTRIEELFRRDARGDAAASRVLAAWAAPLRMAIDSLAAVLDPDLVLLGGGLGQAAHQALAKAPAHASWFQCKVAPAVLGDDAGVIGAGLLALADGDTGREA